MEEEGFMTIVSQGIVDRAWWSGQGGRKGTGGQGVFEQNASCHDRPRGRRLLIYSAASSFHPSGNLGSAHGMVLPTLWVGFRPAMNLLWKFPYRHIYQSPR